MAELNAAKSGTPVRKFEIGGAAVGPPQGAPAAPQGAPADPNAGGDPMAALSGLVQQFQQAPGPEIAMQIAQLVSQIMGGGAPAPDPAMQGAPAGAAPMAQNGMRMPLRVFKAGGKVKAKV